MSDFAKGRDELSKIAFVQNRVRRERWVIKSRVASSYGQFVQVHPDKLSIAAPRADSQIIDVHCLLGVNNNSEEVAHRRSSDNLRDVTRRDAMKATRKLHDIGQSLWLDNITRDILNDGTLRDYINEFSVTGLTSNPTIFDHAMRKSVMYDDAISQKAPLAKSAEELFFELALDDLRWAADHFQPVFERTNGVDGWVSLEVSPLLAHDAGRTLAAASGLYLRAGKRNLFIKIPGTPEGLTAIEAATFAGVPVNVTLLFSREQYLAAADAYMRGVERRIQAGLNPAVASVASIFVSRWDTAVAGKVPGDMRNRLGIAMAQRTYKAYREFLASSRFQRAANEGAVAQRLLWASTGTKDPEAADTLYVQALASPFTVNTMPAGTLTAFADHGEIGGLLASDGGDCEKTLDGFADVGIDVGMLATQLQDEGAAAFAKSWNDLMTFLDSRRAAIRKAS